MQTIIEQSEVLKKLQQENERLKRENEYLTQRNIELKGALDCAINGINNIKDLLVQT